MKSLLAHFRSSAGNPDLPVEEKVPSALAQEQNDVQDSPEPLPRASGLSRIATHVSAAHSSAEPNRRVAISRTASTLEARRVPGASFVARRSAPLPTIDDSTIILTESDIADHLASKWSKWRKWLVLGTLCVVQISMNLNASIYGNAVKGLEKHFGVSESRVLQGQWVFLITYAFGCELWAPWSEDLGRKNVLQASLWLVNLLQILCAMAPSIGAVVGGRALGGLSSAGGSVTLGVVADMYSPAEQQRPVAFVVFASVMGSIVGPVLGAIVEQYTDNWRWIFWLQLIIGVFAALIHLFFCGETRSSVLLVREAKRRRIHGETNIATEKEVQAAHESIKAKTKEIGQIWMRPFYMFVKEPIVLCLSLLSGFSDMLIFLFLEAYPMVYGQWNFGTIANGLAFLP